MKLYYTEAGKLYRPNIQSQEETLLSLKGTEIMPEVATGVFGLSVRADETIKEWSHPFYSSRGECVLVDMRVYQNKHGEPKDRHNMKSFLDRAKLEMAWNTKPEEFETYANELCVAFATWISNITRTRFAVNEIDTARIKVVCVAHYLMALFEYERLRRMNVGEFKSHVARIATRVLRLPPVVVEQVNEDEVYSEFVNNRILDVNMFTAAMASVSTTPMGDLTFPLLLQLSVPGAWAGKDDRQLAAFVFEHPPTLLWMMNQFQELGFFKKVGIGMALDSTKRLVDYERCARFVKGL